MNLAATYFNYDLSRSLFNNVNDLFYPIYSKKLTYCIP